MTDDETEIMFFEEYVESLVDFRMARINYPESDHVQDEKLVIIARTNLFNFLELKV